METFSKNDNLQIIVGKNVKYLRSQAGLTREALAYALDKSISYILMIERGDANISARLAKKICDFFEIEVSILYSNKSIKLKDINKIYSVQKFYDENKNSPNFFINRRKEYSVASFLKEVLISEGILDQYITAGEIVKISMQYFKRALTSQEISRELRRAFFKGKLIRNDKHGNGSVYEYKRNDEDFI